MKVVKAQGLIIPRQFILSLESLIIADEVSFDIRPPAYVHLV